MCVYPDDASRRPSRNERLRVIVSYAVQDTLPAKAVEYQLEAGGFAPLLRERKRHQRGRSQDQIARIIGSGDVVLACISRNPYDREDVGLLEELANEAPQHDAHVIPVRFEQCRIPLPLLGIPAIDLFGPPTYFDIASALNDRLRELNTLRAALTEFAYSGLLGPDGEPLQRRSVASNRLIVDVRNVNGKLLDDLRRNPHQWYELSPNKFEEIVAELLETQGYSIMRTPFSKDGGFDMYAAKKEGLGEFLYLVECKRYRPPNKVGVDVVRSLRGVLGERRATAAALVTTSFFTAGARAFQQNDRHQLSLHDYFVLQEWLGTRQ